MKCTLYTGQKVVCIADPREWGVGEDYLNAGVIFPEKDKVYEIRAVLACECSVADDKKCIGVHLKEIVNEGTGLDEVRFDYRAFRPVLSTQTDISVFKKMETPTELKGQRIKEKV